MVAGFVDPCFRDDQFAVSRTLLSAWITDIHALQGALVALPSLSLIHISEPTRPY